MSKENQQAIQKAINAVDMQIKLLYSLTRTPEISGAISLLYKVRKLLVKLCYREYVLDAEKVPERLRQEVADIMAKEREEEAPCET